MGHSDSESSTVCFYGFLVMWGTYSMCHARCVWRLSLSMVKATMGGPWSSTALGIEMGKMDWDLVGVLTMALGTSICSSSHQGILVKEIGLGRPP